MKYPTEQIQTQVALCLWGECLTSLRFQKKNVQAILHQIDIAIGSFVQKEVWVHLYLRLHWTYFPVHTIAKKECIPVGITGQRPPWTETPQKETPPGQRPLRQTPQTETPWTETPLDRDLWTDPPRQRPPRQRPPRQRPPSGQRPPRTETPTLWTEWHTDVKILPSRNFVEGGKNVTKCTNNLENNLSSKQDSFVSWFYHTELKLIEAAAYRMPKYWYRYSLSCSVKTYT